MGNLLDDFGDLMTDDDWRNIRAMQPSARLSYDAANRQ